MKIRNARAEKHFSYNIKPALRELAAKAEDVTEFGSMGLARLARVQDALAKRDYRLGGLGRVRDWSLLVKNGHKLKQSHFRSSLIPASRQDYPRSLGGQKVFFD